ncbi:MAG: N-acetylneuraminate synthase family protein [Ignavibacteriales bacterium]|nr:N-acetylneuraminate synthase family protein [Melioribacteraceae bacterium]MCF8315148.1 N-acetylneuraminate synthase family protein [Ignavibacteriales bacterium]MCF8435856.1 N-acetylneuraminate synthase family protein [Ignavibacteriales bacterium]
MSDIELKNRPELNISGRLVGMNYDPLVIAELGINHGGSLKVAKEMVDAAAAVGVEIIKHQTHIVEDEMSSEAKKVIPGHTKESIYEIMAKCALDEKDERALQDYVHSKGMIFISTPFSRAAADRLISMDIPAFKVGSGECNNYPLLNHIAEFGKPIILSTGMNSIESIQKAVRIFRDKKVLFALLHCTNVYPTPPEIVRLNAIKELMIAFPDAVVGLSDHTITNYPSIGAVALGASILERHFTDKMDREGPDIVCSMDPKACGELIQASRIVKLARDGCKGPVVQEKSTIDFAYASVVTIKEIKKGESLTKENIWVKRPGTGEILAEFYETLLGKKAKRNVEIDIQLSWKDVE